MSTAKSVSKAIKSKGLGRVRWYCQLCNRQCRDQHGFDSHSTSRRHTERMQLFSDNPEHFVSKYSQQFERGFLEMLRHRWGTHAVEANRVYNEYVKDRDHVHMNATRWVTLAAFVRYLGSRGSCLVSSNDAGKPVVQLVVERKRSDAESRRDEMRRRAVESERRDLSALEERKRLAEQLVGGDGGGEEVGEVEEVERGAALARAEPIRFALKKSKKKRNGQKGVAVLFDEKEERSDVADLKEKEMTERRNVVVHLKEREKEMTERRNVDAHLNERDDDAIVADGDKPKRRKESAKKKRKRLLAALLDDGDSKRQRLD
jgi:DNA/RNA-binding protein KIN17